MAARTASATWPYGKASGVNADVFVARFDLAARTMAGSSAAVVIEDRADQVFQLPLDERTLAAAVAEFTRTGR